MSTLRARITYEQPNVTVEHMSTIDKWASWRVQPAKLRTPCLIEVGVEVLDESDRVVFAGNASLDEDGTLYGNGAPSVNLMMEGTCSSPDYERTAERQAVAEHTGIPLDEICQREYDGIPRNVRYFMRDGEAFVSWQDGLGLNPNQIYRERLLKAVTPSE